MKKKLIIITSLLIFASICTFSLNSEIAQAAPGYINIYTPSSSDIWFKGGSYTIYWNSEDVGNYVRIELYRSVFIPKMKFSPRMEDQACTERKSRSAICNEKASNTPSSANS